MQYYSTSDLDAVNATEWKSAGQIRRICPNCGDTKRHDRTHASFTIDPDTGKYHCKRCDTRGTLIDYWESIAKCPYCATPAEGIQRAEIWSAWKAAGRRTEDRAKAEEAAGQVVGLQVSESGAWNCRACHASGQLRNYSGQGSARQANYTDRRGQQARQQSRAAVSALVEGAPDRPDDAVWLQVWNDARPVEQTSGLAYLQGRGVSGEAARRAGVRFSEFWGRSEKWSGQPAVLFPICDRRGNVVAVSGRAVKPDASLAHQSYGRKTDGVFTTRPNVWQEPTIAICEAPIDALAVEQWFGCPAIAQCGTGVPDWLPLALAYKRVILAHDADEAGDAMAEAIRAAIAHRNRQIERIRPEGAKDWGDLARRWAWPWRDPDMPYAELWAEADRYEAMFQPKT